MSRTSLTTSAGVQGRSAFPSSITNVGPEADALADLRGEPGRRDDAQSTLADLDIHDLLAAHRLDYVHLAARFTLAGGDEGEMLGADPDRRGRRRRHAARDGRQRELNPIG